MTQYLWAIIIKTIFFPLLKLIEAEQQDVKNWKLTSEGENVADNGSYEALVFYGIPPEGINQKELMVLYL